MIKDQTPIIDLPQTVQEIRLFIANLLWLHQRAVSLFFKARHLLPITRDGAVIWML